MPYSLFQLYRPLADSFYGKTWRYDDYAREGFAGSAAVYMCYQKLLPAASNIKLYLSQDGDELESFADMSPQQQALALLLRRPNPHQAYADWVQTYVLHNTLGGIAYSRKIGGGVDILGGKPRPRLAELWWLKPDLVTIKHRGDVLERYQYRPEGQLIELTPEEVCHIRRPHPGGVFEGMPVLSAIEKHVDARTQAIIWNLMLLQNGASPAAVMPVKGITHLPAEEQLRIMAEFQARFSGARNAGKIIPIAADGLDYNITGFNPKDMEWSGGNLDMLRDICHALGVPSKLVGDPEAGTFANYEEARKSLYTETVLPLIQALVDELNNWLVPRYDPTVMITLGTKHIDALSENENDKFERASIATWKSINEQRAMTGDDPYTGDPEADIPIALREPPQPPGGQLPALGDSGRSQRVEQFPGSLYASQADRDRAVIRAEAARLPHEAVVYAALQPYFERQAAKVLAQLDPAAFTRAKGLPADVLAGEAEALEVLLRGMVSGMMFEFGQAAIEQALADGILFEASRPDIQQYLAITLADRSKLITQTTADQIKAVLDETYPQGYEASRDAIRELYAGDISKHRAAAIARTEVGLAQSTATLEGYRQAGVDRKEWISARDDKVRPAHVQADGQVVKINEMFNVGGERMLGPLMGGSAGNVINCRCTMAPLVKGASPL